MKKILSILILFTTINLSAQDNVCDCLEIGIETLQSIQRGATQQTVQKRFEKQNQKCDELSQKLGSNFEKNMASCENFPKFIQLMAGGNNNAKPNVEVCVCVDLSIQILKEFEQGISEEDISKLYQKESNLCDKLSNELGEEQFGLQMMNCEGFSTLMELLMKEEE